jgi:uncharacterized protein (DUF2236 family)
VTAPIVLPWPLRSGLEAATRALFDLGNQSSSDFLQPTGEAALVSPDSLSWRVFKNPLSLFVGGVAAVIMELAEPRVGTGVWEHTTFRINPIGRLQRTGFAAMITIYGARSTAEAMIERVRRVHDRVAGSTPAGKRANDPELLNWVQSTAAFLDQDLTLVPRLWRAAPHLVQTRYSRPVVRIAKSTCRPAIRQPPRKRER